MKQGWHGSLSFLLPAAWLGGLAAVPPPDAAGAAKPKSHSAEPVVDARRVEAIAAMLGEGPFAFGRPIADRAAWDALARKPEFAKVVAGAENLLKTPLPEQPDDLYLEFSRTGNRSRWQAVAGKRRGRLPALALAECLENKGRFVPAIEETIRALCAERTWVMAAHDKGLANFNGESVSIDLGSSAVGWTFATADAVLGDRLSPETRQLLRDNVNRRILDPFRAKATGREKEDSWMRTTNNWNAVCLAGVTGAALASPLSRADRAFYVAAAEAYSKHFLSGFTPDGYCSEGVGYWDYGFGHYLALAEMIAQATRGGLDLMERPEVRAPALYGARIEIAAGVCPAFADCSLTARPNPRFLWFVSRRLGLGLRAYDALDVVAPQGALPETLMFSFPNSASNRPPAPQADEGPGLRSWFEQAGILISRPAPAAAACRLAVALKGGHNAEHHNHNDVGSYVAVVGASPLILDPGSETYTARTFSPQRYESKVLNSFGHPVPKVAGQLQQTGAQARARVLATEFTDKADTLALDIKSAYAVPDLRRLERRFVYSREGAGALTVTDEVEFAQPQAFGTALITYGQWKVEKPGVLLIGDETEAARVEIRVQGGDFEITSEEIHEDVHSPTPPTRIGIDLKQPVTAASITVVITPAASEAKKGVLRNGGFEQGAAGWRIPRDGMAAVTDEQAAEGKHSLKITDANAERGSSVESALVAVDGGGRYELRGQWRPASAKGAVGLYVRCLDSRRAILNKTGPKQETPPAGRVEGGPPRWTPFAFPFEVPPHTAFLQVWIHSFNSSIVGGYLDNLALAPAL